MVGGGTVVVVVDVVDVVDDDVVVVVDVVDVVVLDVVVLGITVVDVVDVLLVVGGFVVVDAVVAMVAIDAAVVDASSAGLAHAAATRHTAVANPNCRRMPGVWQRRCGMWRRAAADCRQWSECCVLPVVKWVRSSAPTPASRWSSD